jgi:hypothetical protein
MIKEFCSTHEKIEALVEEGRLIAKDQWEAIAKKAATSTIKWGVIVFVGIMMATVGFLWNNQRENRNEILVEIKSLTTSINGENGLRDQVKALGWKVDRHIESWPAEKESSKDFRHGK